MNIKKSILLVFLQFVAIAIFSQEKIDLTNNAAYKYYLLEEYQQAIDISENKIIEFPKDAIYRYVAGVSLFKINGDVNKAINYLEFASHDSAIPIDVYYHLGIQYRKNYQFAKSVESLTRYKDLATVNQRLAMQINKEIATSKNGISLTSYVSDIPVVSNDSIDKLGFFQYYTVHSKDRKIVYAPESLLGSGDKANKFKPIICIPNNLKEGTKVVFASYGKNPNTDKNLYIIEYKSEGIWTHPVALPTIINSCEDEDFPCLSSDGLTLYFSSKGLFSLGGYDIFKSHYSKNTKKWSEPESLDFPINSPFDDFLFVPNSDNTVASFVSNRETKPDKLNMYTIQVIKSIIQRPPSSFNEILTLSRLETPKPENTIPIIKINEKVDFSSMSADKNATDNSFDKMYNNELDVALSYQMKADSIRRIVDEKRMSLSRLDNKSDSEVQRAQIKKMEDEIFAIQSKANKAYQDVRTIEEKQFKKINMADSQVKNVRQIPSCYIEKISSPTIISDLELKYSKSTSALENVMNGDLSAFSLNELNRAISDLAVSLQRLTENVSVEISFDEEKIQKGIQLILTGQAIINNSNNGEKYSKQDVENFLRGIKLKFDALQIFETQICSGTNNLISIKGVDIINKLVTGLQNVSNKLAEKPKKKQIEKTIDIIIEADNAIDFELLDSVYYSSINAIPENIEFPKGLIYMVQLGVYNNKPKPSVFKGMKPVSCIIESNGSRKYLVGMFKNSKKAFESLPVIKKQGFNQAFVVPYYNGSKIQIRRAKLLELEDDSAVDAKSNNVL